MENEIMVSVSCLVYNHEKYLRDCLEGFVNQKTNFKFEVLIHDDASTDHSADIIREYEEKYPEIIKPIYQKENQYSRGIKIGATYQYPRVKGKYLAFCEGDDYWTDEYKLQKQFDIMEKNPICSLCVHTVANISEDGQPLNTFRPQLGLKSGSIESETFMSILSDSQGVVFQLSSFFLRSKLLLDHYKDKFMLAASVGDLPLILLLASLGDFYYLEEPMSCYRNSSNGGWTSRIFSNTNMQIKCHNSTINCFILFNEYTNKKFEKYITKKIIDEEFYINLLEKNYRACLNSKYRNQFNLLNMREKLNAILTASFPKLMNYYRTRGKTNEG